MSTAKIDPRIFFYILCLLICYSVFAVDRRNMVAFKIDLNEKQELFEYLEKQHFTLLYEITPTTYIFKYNGEGTLSQSLQTAIDDNKKRIVAVESVKIQEKNTILQGKADYYDESSSPQMPDVTNSNYYGMGVEQTWAEGFTGKGVTIAIMDGGIDIHLLDLERNINTELSYNFVQDNKNVTAEHFNDERPDTLHVTDHGNRVASVLAAVKGNKLCSAGIAYDATIAVLKVYKFEFRNGEFGTTSFHWTASDITSRALVYKHGEIDIYVMPWSLLKPFDKLDLATREALIFGAEKGRRGLGRIYVVPAGPNGNEVTNNIFTITVNGIGREGIVPENTFADTSVLVSGLSEGHNLTSRYMITTTQKNACSDLFRGVSAAASQVAAIIGLALQAYPSLTLRDIQHLIVQSSEYDELDEKHAFICNGAGRYYHRYFGSGLLNATKLVTLAKKQTKTLKLLSVKLENSTEKISDDGLVFQCEFCQGCDDASTPPCLTKIEHVAVSFEFETQMKELRMYLTSPSGTESVLMKATKDLKSKTIGQIVSVNFWDEMALGLWTFRLYSIPSLKDEDNVTTNVTSVTLILYGTSATIPSEKQNRCDSSRQFSDGNDISETDDLEEQSDESEIATIIERLQHLAINFIVISGLVLLAKWLARF